VCGRHRLSRGGEMGARIVSGVEFRAGGNDEQQRQSCERAGEGCERFRIDTRTGGCAHSVYGRLVSSADDLADCSAGPCVTQRRPDSLMYSNDPQGLVRATRS
jgi:hypothetical protein